MQLAAGVTIGEYATTLSYTQPDVAIKTDDSLNFLLPILAQPIVQKIVDGSVLGIETVLIKDIKEDSFGTSLKGSITNAGPCECRLLSLLLRPGTDVDCCCSCREVDAKISFLDGLTIEWKGAPIGSIAMPPIDVVGGAGASFEVNATFKVASVDHLTEFTKAMLTEPSFDWVISGTNLSGKSCVRCSKVRLGLTVSWPVAVAAIGISVPGIALSNKNVTLKGMNSLKGGVKIETFDLPSNDPDGGIHLTLQTNVTNVCSPCT